MSSKSTTSTKNDGDKLEKLVSAYYEALGFKVTRDINVGGHQIDLLASKSISGAGYLTLMIEAKSRKKGAIGINDFTPFKNTAQDLLSKGRIQGALLVTDGRFSQDAQLAASEVSGIRLATVQSLEQDLFNYSESIIRICHDHEHAPEFRSYIPLSGRYKEDTEEIPDLASHVQNWTKAQKPLLIVSGDFGSGKTTILQRVFYESALEKLRTDDGLYPVFFKLRNLTHYSNLWEFISASLRDNNFISPTQRDFERQLDSGRLLVLLDGFDEIDTGANAREKANHLKILAPLLASASPCVLTTRPTYFESFEEMTRILSASLPRADAFQRLGKAKADLTKLLRRLNMDSDERIALSTLKNVIAISQLSDSKVLEYLSGHESDLYRATRCTVEQVREFLFRIYDLEDLMKRPLLLNMIVQTILAGAIDISNKDLTLGPATLYEIYTQLCAKRDVKNRPGGQFLTEDERLRTCRELALLMLETNTIVLKNSDVAIAIERAKLTSITKLPKYRQAEALESALTDIRVCTFLSFSDDGTLRFAHKSFFEFFVAQSLVVECQQVSRAFDSFAKRKLPREVVYFLGSFARDQESFGSAVSLGCKRARTGDRKTLDFFYRLAFGSGILLQNVELNGGTIDSVDLRRAAVGATTIRETQVKSVTVRDLKASNWTLQRCDFREVLISNSSFDVSALDLNNYQVEFDNCVFDDCQINLAGSAWALRRCEMLRGSISLTGAGRLINSRIQDSEVIIFPDLTLDVGTQVTLVGCRVIPRKLSGPWHKTSTKFGFQSCRLAGLWLEISEVIALADPIASGASAVTSLEGCSGVVLTSDEKRLLNPATKLALAEQFPKVVFSDVLSLRKALDLRAEEHSRKIKRESRKAKRIAEGIVSSKRQAERDDVTILELPILQEIRAALQMAGLLQRVDGILAEVLRVTNS